MTQAKSVSLVLGSGGARGHAHIGVIRALEERRLDISNIAGSSMGALIGGIFAADKLDTYEKWATQLGTSDVRRLLDLSFNWTSVFKGERIFEVLADLVGDRKIESLDRGFTAVATSLEEQREVWLNEGSLFRAIRASTAVPGVFSPIHLHNQILVDGGLVNPIPIAPTLTDRTDLTIAVNLSDISEHYVRPAKKRSTSKSGEDSSYQAAIKRFVSGFIDSDTDEVSSPDFRDVLTRSFDVMQGSIARLKLAAYSPDLVVEIPRDACSFFEFHRAAEMSDLGYRKTIDALDTYGL